MSDSRKMGLWLTAMLAAKGWIPAHLARVVGTDKGNVYRWARSERAVPEIWWQPLQDAFGVPPVFDPERPEVMQVPLPVMDGSAAATDLELACIQCGYAVGLNADNLLYLEAARQARRQVRCGRCKGRPEIRAGRMNAPQPHRRGAQGEGEL